MTWDRNGKRRAPGRHSACARPSHGHAERASSRPPRPAPRRRSGDASAASGRRRSRPALSAAAAIMVRAAMLRSAGPAASRCSPPRSRRFPAAAPALSPVLPCAGTRGVGGEPAAASAALGRGRAPRVVRARAGPGSERGGSAAAVLWPGGFVQSESFPAAEGNLMEGWGRTAYRSMW